MLIPRQTTVADTVMRAKAWGLDLRTPLKEVWGITSILRFLWVRQEAGCLVYPGQKADVNAVIAYFTYYHFLSFALLTCKYISTHSSFNCKLLSSHFLIFWFFHFLENAKQMLSDILFPNVIFLTMVHLCIMYCAMFKNSKLHVGLLLFSLPWMIKSP